MALVAYYDYITILELYLEEFEGKHVVRRAFPNVNYGRLYLRIDLKEWRVFNSEQCLYLNRTMLSKLQSMQ